MQRRDRSLVAGVHRLQHVEALGATNLTDDDPVGTHAQRVADEIADRDLAAALDIRRSRLEPHDMVLLQLQLDGVLDRDDPLVARDERREHIEKRRLAGAGATRDEDVHLGAHRRIEHRRDFAGERAEPDEVVARVRGARELSDRERRAVDGQRRDDRIDAGAIVEPGIHKRRGFVDATTDPRDDSFDDAAKLWLAGEPMRRLHQSTVPLDIELVESIDHDLADGRVLEQRLERAVAEHVGADIVDEPVALRGREGELLGGDDLRELCARELVELLLGQGRVVESRADPREELFGGLLLDRGERDRPSACAFAA